MPSLKAIRTRIASVKNTQKITKAMKLVAAARLRRAQDAIIAARPYATRLQEVIADVSARLLLGADDEAKHPLLTARPIKTVRLIIVNSDRGLAGGFNSNLSRRVERFLVDEKGKYPHVEIAVVGRKGREHWKRRAGVASFAHAKVVAEYAGTASDTAVDRARELAQAATQDYLDGKVDAVLVAYNEFKSAISQVVQIQQLLPVVPQKPPHKEGTAALLDFDYEPSKEDVLSTLVPLYVEIELLRVLLESIASEFGARMSAMDNATKNAKEMIGNLTLQFNRARQAAITKELMEIVGGAEALKG
ncbi:MAG TPA: ATP synthase F1 subunit gamma [Polyangia bacterium]|jgi:F-type H+-transporting ATPase subunit gamma|nr:ATP synthase F1 subunit gamma [Polyangia bacterium]HWE28183.1 ATP synthase F1 subunit gamma [Polyangia bacterium]